ncbi:alginate export family protein [Entomobacter blattae]|uniref:Alginate export n=1 Tax=Entomobacter blattae TaxID=2762277 RepID=A0A7H1NQW9_9PROT|nr:alginate export family protein [Entomobacter blattae]QNT78179.1 Alginate export [Entomobacter blattae]
MVFPVFKLCQKTTGIFSHTIFSLLALTVWSRVGYGQTCPQNQWIFGKTEKTAKLASTTSPTPAPVSASTSSKTLTSSLASASAGGVSSSASKPATMTAKDIMVEAFKKEYGVFSAQNGAASGMGAIGNADWALDWGGLCGKDQKDFLTSLKYIPLNDDGDIYLTLSGEARLRYIFDSHPQMGQAGVSNASRVLNRELFGANLRIGPHINTYVQFVHADAGGSNTWGYATGFQRSRIDLQQGILEVKGEVLGAKVGAIGGRMFFLDAPPAFQAKRDLTNLNQTWDGFRGYARWERFRFEVFDLWQTNLSDTDAFAHTTNWNARLYGAYTSYALPDFQALDKKSQLFFDVFFYGYLYGGTPASFATATPLGGASTFSGSSRRDNIGSRLWGNVGPFSIDIDGVYQGGEVRPANQGQSRPVRAYAFNSTISYHFNEKDVPGKLSIGLQSDYFSGGNYNKKSGSVGGFQAPYFPLPDYNDLTTTLTSTNVISTGPLISYNPTKGVFLKLHVPTFWRASTNDGLYSVGKIYSFRDNLQGGFVGSIPQFKVAWSFLPHFTWTHDFAGFIASHGVHKAGGKSSVFYMQTLDFSF